MLFSYAQGHEYYYLELQRDNAISDEPFINFALFALSVMIIISTLLWEPQLLSRLSRGKTNAV